MTTAAESSLEQVVRQEDEQHRAEQAARAEGTQSGENADDGKLFEVPRVAIIVDDSDPNVLKLAFSGSVELERGVKRDADFYNRLKPGRNVALQVEAFVTGPTSTHRRDSEGNVQAVVQTKSLRIHSIELDE